MKITLEQLSGIRKKIVEDEAREKEFQDYYRDREVINSDTTYISQIGDGITEIRHTQNNEEISAFYNLLTCGTYVTEVDTDKIDVGTKFDVLFDHEEEPETYTLVEELVGVNQIDGYVSMHGTFGQAIKGKTDNDRFEYETPTQRKISGTIIEIKKDFADYSHLIKERKIQNRMCHIEKTKLATLIENAKTIPEAQEELNTRNALTISQLNILEIELERLERNCNKKQDASIRAKISVIKRLLKDSKVAITPYDGTIGIGSKFKIKFLLPVEKEMEVELINKAVSTEVDNAYVERISSLGTRLFGLTENEEFAYYNGTTTIAGIVYDIDNSKEKYTGIIK